MTASSVDDIPARDITVLLVEDDPPTNWRLKDALEQAGFDVAAAMTLADARASLAARTPRVLLTDLQLPDGHGVELIRETRARLPDTEIMVISILGDEESVISAITVGATGYILKDAFPTDIARFTDVGLRRCFERAGLHVERATKEPYAGFFFNLSNHVHFALPRQSPQRWRRLANRAGVTAVRLLFPLDARWRTETMYAGTELVARKAAAEPS